MQLQRCASESIHFMLNKAVVTSVWVGSGSSRQQAITIKNLDGGVINDQPGLTTSTPGRETLQHLHCVLRCSLNIYTDIQAGQQPSVRTHPYMSNSKVKLSLIFVWLWQIRGLVYDLFYKNWFILSQAAVDTKQDTTRRWWCGVWPSGPYLQLTSYIYIRIHLTKPGPNWGAVTTRKVRDIKILN